MLLQIENLATPDTFLALQDFIIKFSARFIIDLISVFMLIRFIYFKVNKHRELFFTYFVFNVIIFLMCFFLNKVKLSMGAAFGLFAVFSMIRYKTEDLSIKDMSYLFLVIAIGLMTAVIKLEDIAYYYEFIIIISINGFILLLTYLLESNVLMRSEYTQNITYENLELIKLEKRAELLIDLELKTGLKINRISIGKIDFSKQTATLKIYYFA